MKRRQALAGALALAAFPGACGGAGAAQERRGAPRRGVNLGNALEAPNEGDWGYRIEAAHLSAIAYAGFDSVRLPVRWDAHMAARAPFMIDPALFARVDEVVDAALARELMVQLEVHNYMAMIDDPQGEAARFGAMWRQIAEHYADLPEQLLFEPLNEPHGGRWTGAQVTRCQRLALEAIRPSNPTRLVVLDGPDWSSINGLAHWAPPDDPHIIATAHYYEPYAFTHQGAQWVSPQPSYSGRWGDQADRKRLAADIGRAADWARAAGVPLQIGEFGVIGGAPLAQRALWTRAVREACETEGLGWMVWDFAGAFPIYDVAENSFIPEMLDALLR